ncbi:MAG: DUF2784 domain-containing protein, partial [Planctomycetaceae bacterium]
MIPIGEYSPLEAHPTGMEILYRLAADVVLVLHFGYVAFVVLGLLAVVAGAVRGWKWIRNPWLRWLHLAAILVVAVESWLDVVCPLTTLENWLRAQAGIGGGGGGGGG